MFLRYIFVLSLIILASNFTPLHSETEPNNTPAQANPINVNGSDSGTLSDVNDNVDWRKVTLPSDGKLVVATLAVAGLEIDNYIYDQDGVSMLASYAYGGSHDWDTSYFFNMLAGTYYIRTYAYSGAGAYTITNHFYPANYQNDPENNDSALVASSLSLNGSATGHLGFYSMEYTDTQDWWKVTVPSDGKLVIATLSDPTIEIDNYIYDQDGNSMLAQYAYGGSHTWDTAYFVNLIPGTYYIKSYCYSGYGGYTITNHFVPANLQNDSEPNDSASIAIPLALNGNSTGHLGFYSMGKTDTEDWRKITVPSDGELVVATFSDSTIELDNYIYDQDKKTMIASYEYAGSHQWDTTYFPNLTPGTYYIRTLDYGGYGAYTISNNFIPAQYENDPEPNDSIPIAKSIQLNTVRSGHLHYYNQGKYDDNDCFSFTVNSVWDTLFIRTDSSPTLELDFNLYNSAGNQIAHSGMNGTTELLVYVNLQPGTYYVNAYCYSGYGSYLLIVTNTRPSGPLVGVKSETAKLIPSEFELKQNYPNPFNPTTKIQYSIAARGIVSLKVFDVLGREAAVLVNEMKDAGYYEVNFNGSKLAFGLYIYILKVGDFSASRKMMMVK